MSNGPLHGLYRTALGEGLPPYGWQLQLAEREWPKVLIAPTGAGKTAGVTLAWAAHRLRAASDTPRRLVWCFPMRVLAEQTTKSIADWFRRLKQAGVDPEGRLPASEDVHLLMGGVEAGRWLDHPERPAVLVGTQDMLLSRALMRGYASSRALWPIEFAFLHEDAQWVFDEVQLMGAGRATSAQLEGFRHLEACRSGQTRCPSRSLWMSATLAPEWLRTVDHPAPAAGSVLRVEPGTGLDDRLSRLSKAVKNLHRSDVRPSSTNLSAIRAYIAAFAEQILRAHQQEGLTLVIVNRVSRAQDLYGAISKRLAAKRLSAPELSLVHSRFRAADRKREMARVLDRARKNQIVIATQAVEAGVDLSAKVMFTELAPWSSMVQRFGRANRYAEFESGAEIHWIDLIGNADVDGKEAGQLALPYSAGDLAAARDRLSRMRDAAPANLGKPGDIAPPSRVLRRKDLSDLFDTDPDLTGFDVDISPYIRDAEDTDVRVFWRSISDPATDPLSPRRDELCAVPIRDARQWFDKARKQGGKGAPFYIRDAQWRRREGDPEGIPGWQILREQPWPGMTVLATLNAGGYSEAVGFTGNPQNRPGPVAAAKEETSNRESDGHDEDPLSRTGRPTSLPAHLQHVAAEADALCRGLGIDPASQEAVVRASRWHDLGKAHHVFQKTMRAGLGDCPAPPDELLAKTVLPARHERPYFRHELASALAFLAHESWRRHADLVAYLIAAHHGKVRMNLRALPREKLPTDEFEGNRFARGIWEGEELPAVTLGAGEVWAGGRANLSLMELGLDDETGASWTERTRALLAREGPFGLAWLEALVRIADWRASAKERKGAYPDA